MLLRVVRGLVEPGFEEEFVRRVRSIAAGDVVPRPGLVNLQAGYQRVEGRDHFVIATAWKRIEDMHRALGPAAETQPRTARLMREVASFDEIDHYELIEPVDAGVLDAPGAIVRVVNATVRDGMGPELHAFVRSKHAELLATRLLLGFQFGRRLEPDGERVVAITGWAGPFALEEVAEPGRRGKLPFAALDEFVEGVTIDRYQAIELHLPESLHSVGGRRIVAARFEDEGAAEGARRRITAEFPEAGEAGVGLAPLGSVTYDTESGGYVLVARVRLASAARAERLILDLDGILLYASDEGRVA